MFLIWSRIPFHIKAESNFRRQSVEQQHEQVNSVEKTQLVRTCHKQKEKLNGLVLQVTFSRTTALKLTFKSLKASKDRRELFHREDI